MANSNISFYRTTKIEALMDAFCEKHNIRAQDMLKAGVTALLLPQLTSKTPTTEEIKTLVAIFRMDFDEELIELFSHKITNDSSSNENESSKTTYDEMMANVFKTHAEMAARQKKERQEKRERLKANREAKEKAKAEAAKAKAAVVDPVPVSPLDTPVASVPTDKLKSEPVEADTPKDAPEQPVSDSEDIPKTDAPKKKTTKKKRPAVDLGIKSVEGTSI